jgi:hypothetical protein
MGDPGLLRAARLIECVVERSHKVEQGKLLLRRQTGELIGDEAFVGRNNILEELLAARREEQPIGPPFLAALDELTSLHPIEKLANVAFGHKQRICKLLLSDSRRSSDMSKYVELGHAQAAAAHLIL